MTEDQNKEVSEEKKPTNDLLLMLIQAAINSDTFKRVLEAIDLFKKGAEVLYAKIYAFMEKLEFEPERLYIILMLLYSHQTIEKNKSDNRENKTLEKSTDEVQKFAAELVRNNRIEKELRQKIFSAMYASFGMGLTVEDRRIVLAEWEANRANIARRGKQAKAAERNARLIDAVLAVAAELRETPADSEKFAQRIRPDVRERLGLPREGSDYPAISSIRRSIREHRSSN